MKNRNRYTVLSILLFALIYGVGCGPTTTAPKGWLPSISDAQHESYGGWATVKYHTGDSEGEVHGELITIHPNQIFILTDQYFTNISIDCITYMKLTTIQLSRDTEVDKRRQMMYPLKPLDAFRAYARFPQGMPEGIDVQSLKPKKQTGITPSNASIEGRPRAVNSVKSSSPQTQIRPMPSENGTVNNTKHSLPDSKPIVNEGVGTRLEILGTSVPGIDISGIIPGGGLGVFYRKGPLVLDINSRLFSKSHQDSNFVSFSAAIGGRYHFLNKRNISPYLGGGLTWDYTHYEKVERELREVCLDWDVEIFFFIPIPVCKEWGYEWQDILYTYNGGGLGVYGIIGIEFRHLHQSRFNLELRIDNPFHELDTYANQRSISLGIPISLGISWLHQF